VELQRLICGFLARNANKAYKDLRWPLANFCLDFGIDLELFADVADGFRKDRPNDTLNDTRSWVETTRRDLSLRAFHRISSARL
jgi:hypothetical protein